MGFNYGYEKKKFDSRCSLCFQHIARTFRSIMGAGKEAENDAECTQS